MKLLDVLLILAVMLLFLFVSMSQEKDLERLEKRITSLEQSIKLDTQRITNLENPQFIQKEYKPTGTDRGGN